MRRGLWTVGDKLSEAKLGEGSNGAGHGDIPTIRSRGPDLIESSANLTPEPKEFRE